tara:strand:- start:440 stop:625 length:186 start_codon:yes stop_codon:yes gene_type:complete
LVLVVLDHLGLQTLEVTEEILLLLVSPLKVAVVVDQEQMRTLRDLLVLPVDLVVDSQETLV